MSEKNYRGQWIGTSDSGSYCIVNINDHGLSIDGRVSIFESTLLGGAHMPIWTMAYFQGSKNEEGKVFGTVNPPLTYWQSGQLQTDSERKEFQDNAGIAFPIETSFQADKNGLYQMEVFWASKYPSGERLNDRVVLEKKRLGSSKVY